MTSPEWKKYEHEVADLMSQLGFTVAVDEELQGARGSHDIDVTARITVGGIKQLWIIECKKWRRPVPKERVLTFLSIVSDVGADRGLIFAESGFQAGAIRVANNTNVTLTSVPDFQQNAANELHDLRIKALDERAASLMHKFSALWDLNEPNRQKVAARYIGPPNILGQAEPSSLLARISQMREALEAAQFERWPVYYYALDGELPIYVKEWEGLFFVIDETLSTCENIYDHMLNPESQANHWTELQSPELTELLDRIREM